MFDKRLLAIARETGIAADYWAALKADPERERRVTEPAAIKPIPAATTPLVDPDGNVIERPRQGTTITVRAAARKYGMKDPTISRWASRGILIVLSRPEAKGLPVELDEQRVYDAVSLYLRSKPDKSKGKRIMEEYARADGTPRGAAGRVQLAAAS